MSSPMGAILFAAIVLLDQFTKWLILNFLPRPGVVLTPFFNLVLVWNPGISFGMLSGGQELGRWGLVAVTLAISAGLIVWLRREHRLAPKLALWVILAGALGNVADRIRFGAVVDFLDLHAAGYHWPAFNVADSAVVIGAVLLVIDGLVLSRAAHGKAEEKR